MNYFWQVSQMYALTIRKYLIYQQSVKLEEFCNKNILNTVHEDKIILQFIQFIPFVIKV